MLRITNAFLGVGEFLWKSIKGKVNIDFYGKTMDYLVKCQQIKFPYVKDTLFEINDAFQLTVQTLIIRMIYYHSCTLILVKYLNVSISVKISYIR